MNTGFRQATQAALDGLDGRQRLGGIPLGRLQVFAPIRMGNVPDCPSRQGPLACVQRESPLDRKTTRLNSSHGYIPYAVFCLKKKIAPSRARCWPWWRW